MFYVIAALIGFFAIRGIVNVFTVLNQMAEDRNEKIADGWEDVRSGEIVMRG